MKMTPFLKMRMMMLLLGRNPICHLFLTQWSATTSVASTSQSPNEQAKSATRPKYTTTPLGEPKLCDFYSTYTHIYAPITIDSSSSDLEVEKLSEKDGYYEHLL
ncbi:hypothetical protein DPX16_11642 [Anabarilius grahami]|uniref:Uncharacterized protein n=1 Tax=Anabarilius grahami TaxID=495550 RepID=A0A3N0Z3Z5_ANAGA|nr:hypothetical protein DPX16_11642 [Anabarilius grahami]